MFEAIDREIMVSRKFLEFKNDSLDTEIEVILSKSLIITICSSYEEEIQKTIKKRLKSCTDFDLTKFTLSLLKGSQYLAYTDLKGKILDKFGESYVTKFENFTNPQIISDYDSLVSGRHKGSHTTKFVGTFEDIVKYHTQGKQVIIAFQNTLKI